MGLAGRLLLPFKPPSQLLDELRDRQHWLRLAAAAPAITVRLHPRQQRYNILVLLAFLPLHQWLVRHVLLARRLGPLRLLSY